MGFIDACVGSGSQADLATSEARSTALRDAFAQTTPRAAATSPSVRSGSNRAFEEGVPPDPARRRNAQEDAETQLMEIQSAHADQIRQLESTHNAGLSKQRAQHEKEMAEMRASTPPPRGVPAARASVFESDTGDALRVRQLEAQLRELKTVHTQELAQLHRDHIKWTREQAADFQHKQTATLERHLAQSSTRPMSNATLATRPGAFTGEGTEARTPTKSPVPGSPSVSSGSHSLASPLPAELNQSIEMDEDAAPLALQNDVQLDDDTRTAYQRAVHLEAELRQLETIRELDAKAADAAKADLVGQLQEVNAQLERQRAEARAREASAEQEMASLRKAGSAAETALEKLRASQASDKLRKAAELAKIQRELLASQSALVSAREQHEHELTELHQKLRQAQARCSLADKAEGLQRENKVVCSQRDALHRQLAKQKEMTEQASKAATLTERSRFQEELRSAEEQKHEAQARHEADTKRFTAAQEEHQHEVLEMKEEMRRLEQVAAEKLQSELARVEHEADRKQLAAQDYLRRREAEWEAATTRLVDEATKTAWQEAEERLASLRAELEHQHLNEVATLEQKLREMEVVHGHPTASTDGLEEGHEQAHSPQPQAFSSQLQHEHGQEQEFRFEVHFTGEGKLGVHLEADEHDSQIYLESVHIGSLAASDPLLQERFDCRGTGGLRDVSQPVVLRRISEGRHRQEIQGLSFDRVLELLRSAKRPLSLQFAVLRREFGRDFGAVRVQDVRGSSTTTVEQGHGQAGASPTPSSAVSSASLYGDQLLELWELPGWLNPRAAEKNRQRSALLQQMNKALLQFQRDQTRGYASGDGTSALGTDGMRTADGGVDRHSFLEWAAQRPDCKEMIQLHYDHEQVAARAEAKVAATSTSSPAAGAVSASQMSSPRMRLPQGQVDIEAGEALMRGEELPDLFERFATSTAAGNGSTPVVKQTSPRPSGRMRVGGLAKLLRELGCPPALCEMRSVKVLQYALTIVGDMDIDDSHGRNRSHYESAIAEDGTGSSTLRRCYRLKRSTRVRCAIVTSLSQPISS